MGWMASLVLLAASSPADVTFDTAFEGGSLGTIERRGDATFRLHVRGQQDERGRNRQASWYFFRLRGVRGRALELTLTDFVGEYDGRPGACPMGPGILPVVSGDGERWTPAPEVAWDDRTKEATLRLRPEGDTLWVAHQPPYTPARLARLLERLGRAEEARVEVVGKTLGGRDLVQVTASDPETPDRDKATVWLVARQHAWESGTSFVMEGALEWATSDDPAARAMRRRVVFVFTPMADPDGCAAGTVRFNALGYDLNRHWDEVDLRRKGFLERMPEIWYVKRSIRDTAAARRVRLLVNLHNTETAEYLATPADDPATRALVGRLASRLAREAGFRPSRGPVFGEPARGTMGALGAEMDVPVVLLEQRIANDPETGRPPSVEGRRAFGAALIRLMGEEASP